MDKNKLIFETGSYNDHNNNSSGQDNFTGLEVNVFRPEETRDGTNSL
jgi:hypothetical protein